VLTTELATSKRVTVDIESQQVNEVPAGLGVHEAVIGWTENGTSLVIWNQEMPAKVGSSILQTDSAGSCRLWTLLPTSKL